MNFLFVTLIFLQLINTCFGGYDLINDLDKQIRKKRYVLSTRKWPIRTLTWTLKKTPYISNSDKFLIRNTLHRAFNLWASVSSLEFVELPEGHRWEPDISIAFVKGKHGDNMPFDGREGIVAHAFYPTLGILHFDADENWTLNQPTGINLYQTAVHEIGHLLGLEHSTDTRAVMYPKNRKYDLNYELSDDDVRGIRRLYPQLKKYRFRKFAHK
uniref:Peptidase metallopeptidase domain-containing protein n=1 Tax=Panagrolaimus superbus TaxID=310955 RepID=A0A914YZ99_9BILA